MMMVPQKSPAIYPLLRQSTPAVARSMAQVIRFPGRIHSTRRAPMGAAMPSAMMGRRAKSPLLVMPMCRACLTWVSSGSAAEKAMRRFRLTSRNTMMKCEVEWTAVFVLMMHYE